MQESYIPKASEWEFCDWINLCTVRKTDDWVSKIWIKDLSWNISEEILETIINSDTYNWKKIVRVYSSWHIFLSDDKKEVFLVTTEKDWKTQHQFTWWSPLEEENQEVIYKYNGVYKFDIQKVRNNAKIRTQNRTWVEIIEEYNEKPLVDWALMENEENWEIYYKLVCLMHFVVKKYEKVLSYTWKENTTWWNWYKIDDLENTENIAPNAYIVSKKTVELLWRLDKTIIITDFSKTLTSHENPTTWWVFAKSWLLGEEYTKERNKYYEEYHNFELQWNVQKTKQWWWEHLDLFSKYWLTKKMINQITNSNYFVKRNWLENFIKTIQEKWIKLFIASSWVSDFIESFLIQNWISDEWIEIYGNSLIFNDNWKVIWFDNKSIVTTLNKWENKFDLEFYWKVILLWDDSSDLDMYNWNCLKIWFCESNEVKWYDIYLWNNGDLNEVLNNI